MASSRSLRETVGDVTECSICTESMVDPRQLPCIHTFCFNCLDQLWKDKQPGATVPCPLCRAEFIIPVEGVSSLPKNFFIEKLMEAQKVSETEHAVVRCDICLKHEAPDSSSSVSEIFCTECEQHMCKMCLKCHSSMNTTSKHRIIPTGSKLTAAEGLMHYPEARCPSHKGKEIDIYCMECKAAVCTICFITQHNGHKCSDIQQVTEDLKKRIRSDIEDTRKIVVEVDIASKQLENSLEDFNLSVKETESNIVQTGEKMKQLIDTHVRDLLQELGDEKIKRIKEFESVREELLVQRLSLESFIKYSEKILEKAVAADVASVANSLSVSGVSLKNKKMPRIGSSLKMSFIARDSLISEADVHNKNSVGKISVCGNIASGYIVSDFLSFDHSFISFQHFRDSINNSCFSY